MRMAFLSALLFVVTPTFVHAAPDKKVDKAAAQEAAKRNAQKKTKVDDAAIKKAAKAKQAASKAAKKKADDAKKSDDAKKAASNVESGLVVLSTTKGDIYIKLYPKKAPKTVENFLNYVKSGFYNGTIFHRVISNFMIQGGGLTANMEKKKTNKPIQNEADNGLSNKTGTIAMARTGYPHSATAQFFINVKDNLFLDHRNKSGRGWGYCVFGKVVKGMDVVNAIRNVETSTSGGRQNVPVKPVVITKAYVTK